MENAIKTYLQGVFFGKDKLDRKNYSDDFFTLKNYLSKKKVFLHDFLELKQEVQEKIINELEITNGLLKNDELNNGSRLLELILEDFKTAVKNKPVKTVAKYTNTLPTGVVIEQGPRKKPSPPRFSVSESKKQGLVRRLCNKSMKALKNAFPKKEKIFPICEEIMFIHGHAVHEDTANLISPNPNAERGDERFPSKGGKRRKTVRKRQSKTRQ